jgi:hypothetical protein
MKGKIIKLLDVKTIVTFTLTAAFTYLSVRGKIEPQVFMTIYTMIIGFYFGTQHEKNNKQ